MRSLALIAAAAMMSVAQPAEAKEAKTLHIGDPNTWAAFCTQFFDSVSANSPQVSANKERLQMALQEVHRYYGLGARERFLSICQMVADDPQGYWSQQGRLALKLHNDLLAAQQ